MAVCAADWNPFKVSAADMDKAEMTGLIEEIVVVARRMQQAAAAMRRLYAEADPGTQALIDQHAETSSAVSQRSAQWDTMLIRFYRHVPFRRLAVPAAAEATGNTGQLMAEFAVQAARATAISVRLPRVIARINKVCARMQRKRAFSS